MRLVELFGWDEQEWLIKTEGMALRRAGYKRFLRNVALGRYDGTARLLFSTWRAWALAATGAPLLWLFLVPEFCWGVAQWLPVAQDGGGSSTVRAPFTSAAPMRSSRGG